MTRSAFCPRRPASELTYDRHGKTTIAVPMTRRVVARMLQLHDLMEQDAGQPLTRGEVVSRLIELGAKAYEQRKGG